MDMGTSSSSSGTSFDLAEVRRWVHTLHGTSDGLIWVGRIGDMVGVTRSDPEDVISEIADMEARYRPQGIYLRTTTLSKIPRGPKGERSRGTEQDSFILPGFAADLDIAGPGHATSKTLPPDEASAMQIVAESGLPIPTMWVHSGGGLYPWWLLENPQDIREPADLARAKDLSEKIQKILVVTGDKLGWHVGGEVGDMARMLRVPGTVNRKEGLERPCRILEPASLDHYFFTELETAVGEIFDALPKPKAPEYKPRVSTPGTGLSPLDDWEAKSDWIDIPNWPFEFARHNHHETEWLRIGSTSGARLSATTGRAADRDRLYCFTSETVFEARKPYNKQAAYVLLNYGSVSSDAFSRASSDLRKQGFGGELPKLDRAVDAVSLVRPAQAAPAVAEQAVDEQPAKDTLVAVQANNLPVLGQDGLPSLGAQVYTSQHWDEMGLASMYSSTFCPTLRFLPSIDEWRIWDGQRWARDDLARHQLASRNLLTGLLAYARGQEASGNERGKELVKSAVRLATLSRVGSIVKVAKTDQCISAVPEEFDTHKNLVTVENGILDLSTGTLADFDPDLMLTKKVKAIFDPAAKGPRTTKFLESIQPDPQVLAYMKRLVGYTLLGGADERVLPIVHGASGSGKSAFLEMLYYILGDFGAVADPSTLMPLPDTYQGPSEKLHSLMGTRFVKMSELPENASLNQALVKSITGSDTQKTRPLFGHLVEWQVEYTVWMATNNLPKITSTDGAIWKRVKPIHFPNVFVNEDGSAKNAADKDLGRQLAKEEGSFILNWILEGIAEYRKYGLAEPDQIGAALTGYRDEMDTTRQFLTEAQENGQIKVEEGQTIPARDLYKIYLAWATDAQIRFTLSINTFRQRLQVNGFEQVKTSSANVWKGIGVAGFIGQAQTPSQGNRGMERLRN